MSTLTQAAPPVGFILSEANGQRSRENFIVEHGRKVTAGQLVHSEPAVSLTTTGNTHSNTTLNSLAAVTGLVNGDIYAVTGSGIPAGTTFTFTGSSAGTLSAAASTSLTGTAITLTRPAGVGPWLDSSDTVSGVAMYDADGTDAQLSVAVLARDAEVKLTWLVYPATHDVNAVAGLEALGIIVRN